GGGGRAGRKGGRGGGSAAVRRPRLQGGRPRLAPNDEKAPVVRPGDGVDQTGAAPGPPARSSGTVQIICAPSRAGNGPDTAGNRTPGSTCTSKISSTPDLNSRWP